MTQRDSAQVTQRPGCSCFATSVSTLTTGSHATVRATGCLLTAAAGAVLRASLRVCATGTRTRTEVSERPSTTTEIVCVFDDTVDTSARSALACRLTVACSAGTEACWPRRSLPEASCAAPKLSETASAPKIPENTWDMACPPLSLSVAATANRFTTQAAMSGSERGDH